MRSFRAGTWRWLGAVALCGGLLAGGGWYAAANDLTPGLPVGLVTGAFAQEAPTPAAPATAAPDKKNGRKPMGEVTQITAEPAGFTIHTPAGADVTFSVLDSTVFMAGPDRPYRFELLKAGDHVVVKGGAKGKVLEGTAATAQAATVPGQGNGQGKNKQARANAVATADGTPIARRVMVRPAGEQPRRQKNKAEPAALSPASTTNGGSHGTGQ